MNRSDAIAYILALGEAFASEYATSSAQHDKVAADTAAALRALGVPDDGITGTKPAEIVDDLYGDRP